MKDNKKESIQLDGSDGEKISKKPTLVRKGIRTFYGIVEDSLQNKEENYNEIGHAEDRRIVNAAIALRSRLSSKEREEAQEWNRNFRALVGEWMC
jgi:secreted protein with Ig-like and vWFA domain